MIAVSVTIERTSKKVWDYFTTPSNWVKWYGGGLKEAAPGWQDGANLIWALGGASAITKVIPGKEISTAGKWMDTTYKFKPEGLGKTTVELILSDPKGGASFNDGGAAEKRSRESMLLKLKQCIESETIN
jgi:uncharacterized protein YndB with AHSA1/START domain